VGDLSTFVLNFAGFCEENAANFAEAEVQLSNQFPAQLKQPVPQMDFSVRVDRLIVCFRVFGHP
jgi:hypothetical protein